MDREAKVEKDGSQAGHAFRVARLPGVAEIIDEPWLGRACYREDGSREKGQQGKRADASREKER